MNFLFCIIISYLIGAIPTAYIFGKLYKGIDIRQHGSGNVGATNVFRVLGKWPGTVVLLLDIFKGIIPIVFVANFFGATGIWPRIILGIVAICGHNWTVFLKFKGGKGVATTLGVLIGFTIEVASIRPVLALTVLSFFICLVLSRYVSLSSIFAALVLPILMVTTAQPFELTVMSIIFCLFVVIRHRPNIKRLLSGNESKVPMPFDKRIL